jgi:adenine-specific DNA-methyltransferase
MPTTKTLIPAKDESVNFDETENIFIEGENLEVLKVLQKSCFGKVKMIYIDPPYNTGNDSFIYPDKFSESKADYEKRVGDKDEEGNKTSDSFKKNSKENGQYHSNWLNMMMPRLYLAKNLLRQDGVIFVSIDDNEVHNLRLLMNEIFGEENFVAEFVWKRRASSALAEKLVSMDHEYVISYQKADLISFNGIDKDYASYKNPDNDIRGDWTLGDLTVGMTSTQRPNQFYPLKDPITNNVYLGNADRVWAYIPESMQKLLDERRVLFPKDTSKRPMLKRFKNDLKSNVNPISTLLMEVGMNSEATKEFRELFNQTIFNYGKPLSLIKTIVKQLTNSNDLVLDFFAGSGTTAHAVMDLNAADGGNRKSISVQLPELTDEKSEAYKAGYKTIAEISKERIRRAGKKIQEEINVEIKKIASEIKKLQGELPTDENKTEIENLKIKIKQLKAQDLGFKVLKLADSNFKQWQQIEGKDAKALAEQMKLFVDPVSESATIENMVYELLLKSGKDLNSPIKKKDSFYKINDNELILLLEKATQEIIDLVIAEKPIKVVALDKLFKGNDQLKTNTVLQMKDAGIEFKTI